jgi:hypothetical protein
VHDRISAGFVLTLGLALCTVAFLLWAVESTVVTRGPLQRESAALLAEPPIRESMGGRVADAIAAQLPPGTAVSPAVVLAVADRTLDQPAFVIAFSGGLDQVQEHVVDGAVNPIGLDPVLVAQAARDASANEPSLAALLAPARPLVVGIPDEEIPDLARWADFWSRATRALLFLAIVLVTYGALRVEHKPWAVGRIGRWALVVGASTLVLFWALPHVLFDAIGGWFGVAGVVVAGDDHLVPISLLLALGGALAILGAHRWEAHDRKRVLAVIPGQGDGASTASWQSPV